MLPPLRETLVTTERLVLAPPFRADFAEWADLRERSRTHLEPWEPVQDSLPAVQVCFSCIALSHCQLLSSRKSIFGRRLVPDA